MDEFSGILLRWDVSNFYNITLVEQVCPTLISFVRQRPNPCQEITPSFLTAEIEAKIIAIQSYYMIR